MLPVPLITHGYVMSCKKAYLLRFDAMFFDTKSHSCRVHYTVPHVQSYSRYNYQQPNWLAAHMFADTHYTVECPRTP